MKDFIAVFIACMIVLVLFAMFSIQNIWGLITGGALFLATIITILMKLATKLESLEQKLDALVKESTSKNE